MRIGLLTISAASLLSVAAGCGSQQVAVPSEPASALTPPASSRGLTVRWIALAADEGQIALLRQLEPHLVKPTGGLNAVDQRRWLEQGLAVAIVPATAVRQIEKGLPVTAMQANNSPDLLVWTAIATGPAWEVPRPVASPDGTTEFDPGRLRLLARSWAAPSLTAAGPALVTRLELLVQHLPTTPPLISAGAAPVTAKGAISRGPTFGRTALGVDLLPNECLVVFSEVPGTDRQALLRPETVDRPETAAAASSPQPERLPTLGELLLSGMAPDGQIRTRVVLIIMGQAAAGDAGLDR